MKLRHVLAAAIAITSMTAFAESQFGVEVYPAAKSDPEVAKMIKDTMKFNASTYRTTDSVEKVTEFYRKQKLKENPGTSKQGSGFMGNGVMVTVQNPWADMKTGKMNNDTLISIVKQ